MQIIDIDGKKYFVLEKILLDHFKSEESKNNYTKGKICLLNKNNLNECLIAQEILEAQFEDIVKEKINTEIKEEESLQEELPPKQNGFSHTINIKI